jgi:hypothetical protein
MPSIDLHRLFAFVESASSVRDSVSANARVSRPSSFRASRATLPLGLPSDAPPPKNLVVRCARACPIFVPLPSCKPRPHDIGPRLPPLLPLHTPSSDLRPSILLDVGLHNCSSLLFTITIYRYYLLLPFVIVTIHHYYSPTLFIIVTIRYRYYSPTLFFHRYYSSVPSLFVIVTIYQHYSSSLLFIVTIYRHYLSLLLFIDGIYNYFFVVTIHRYYSSII